MLAGKKAVIFDMDGTLLDSMWMWRSIDVEYLDRFGIALPEGLQREIEGKSYTETAIYFHERFLPDRSVEEIKQDWYEMSEKKYRTQVFYKPGAELFLSELKRRGIKMAIATSNSMELVKAAQESLHLERYIDFVCTGCSVARGKPAPDVYLKAAEELGISPLECLVFEDVPMGILAGKNAGMKVCAVEDDFSRDQEETIRALADYYIRDYREVLDGTYEKLHGEKEIRGIPESNFSKCDTGGSDEQ
ncbi:MAG: HAD family phosphatase [Lachnospiraceae bacterium]|nr:HAD family phosphatase [Robinsoniella sp.]MDY3767679.1 HAD family phosphatase [Lachnospiraceae bacterium]